MKWFFFLISLSSTLFSQIDYQNLLKQFPETLGRNGCWKQGEIEIVTSPCEINRIQNQTRQRLIRKGYSKEDAEQFSHIGIIAEDQYWVWVRDAVMFPGGIPGTYNRIVWKNSLSGVSGAVILPVLSNNKIVVNINFRHATRSWEMELPRGGRRETEDNETAARRELKEETGCKAKELIHLGNLAPETGLVSGTVPVYYCKVCEKKKRHQDESEAIALNLELTLDQVYDAFKKGYLVTEIKGVKTKVFCRDPYFSYALLQAKLRNLI